MADAILLEHADFKGPLCPDFVLGNETIYSMAEDRGTFAWAAAPTFEVRTERDGGGQALRLAGHILSPFGWMTGQAYGDPSVQEPDRALFSVRRALGLWRRRTFRVLSVSGRLRFTISKGFWGRDCSYWFFGCKFEWFVHKGLSHGRPLYHALGEDREDGTITTEAAEPDGKAPEFVGPLELAELPEPAEVMPTRVTFYKMTHHNSLGKWAAHLDRGRQPGGFGLRPAHATYEGDSPAVKVTVRGGEDAALLLTSAALIDRWERR